MCCSEPHLIQMPLTCVKNTGIVVLDKAFETSWRKSKLRGWAAAREQLRFTLLNNRYGYVISRWRTICFQGLVNQTKEGFCSRGNISWSSLFDNSWVRASRRQHKDWPLPRKSWKGAMSRF
jgi:hypothetical protein